MPRTQLKQLSQPSYPGSKPIKHSDAFSPIIRTLSGKLILTSRGRVAFAKTHRGRLSHFQPTRGSTLATKWREGVGESNLEHAGEYVPNTANHSTTLSADKRGT